LKIASTQKLMILKSGILFLMLAPFIFFVLETLAYKTFEVKAPSLYIETSAAMQWRSFKPVPETVYWPYYVSLFYGIGVAFVTLQLVRNYFVTKKWLSNSTESSVRGQSVYLNSNISSPLSFGFFQPKIYFPTAAPNTWTERELEMALSHEQNHVLRQDPLWKLISLFVRSLLFFAPWMYALHRKLELEMEILCDETTCVQTQAPVSEYGNFLLALVCQEKSNNVLITNITDSTLKRRIVAMKSRKIQRPVFAALFSASILLLGTTAIAVSSGVTAKKTMFRLATIISKNGKELASPKLETPADEITTISVGEKDEPVLTMKLKMQDVALKDLKDGIGVDFNIDVTESGKTSHSKAKIVLAPNDPGSISVTADDGQVFDVQIKAVRL
ncbi:MAG: M56 family metallopeptidase, partial [Bdellovibrio sp.]|nr:M56 family metallopeptidase [Bdellovibrio sp.]